MFSRTVEFVPGDKGEMIAVVHHQLICQVGEGKMVWRNGSQLFIVVSLTVGNLPHSKVINAKNQ